jgi:hypothetical protein
MTLRENIAASVAVGGRSPRAVRASAGARLPTGVGRKTGMWAVAPLLVVALLAGSCGDAPPDTALRIDPARVELAADIGDALLAFAVDLDQVTGGTFWDPAGGPTVVPVAPYDFDRPRLVTLARALSPAYLRIGGSASDRTFYDLSDAPASSPPPRYATQLTRAEWDAVNRFAADLGLQIILTVNAGAGPRQADGTWTADNAYELLSYTAEHAYPVTVLEFGNEPNQFALRAGVLHYTASAYARDLAEFRALRDAVLPSARIAAPGNIFTRTLAEDALAGVIFGPRTSAMLPLVAPLIDIVSYHYYAAVSTRCPPVGPRVDPESALDPAYLDGVDETVTTITALRDDAAPGKPVWMTESGGQSCGGQVGVADRFLNSFWYLNTLARLAQAGQQVFVRWTLSGSTYGLIDDATLEPRPDYWAAVLWHRLAGGRVLALGGAPVDSDLRLYACCTRGGPPGAVTLIALNPSRTRTLRLDVGGAQVDLYRVTAPDPAGMDVRLNDAVLAVAADGSLPEMAARSVRGDIALPPVSYAFIVVPRAGAAACQVGPVSATAGR